MVEAVLSWAGGGRNGGRELQDSFNRLIDMGRQKRIRGEMCHAVQEHEVRSGERNISKKTHHVKRGRFVFETP